MFIVALLIGLGISCVYAVFGAWMFMLAVGVIHAEWIHQLPTLGYGWAFVIILLLRSTFMAISGPTDD